MKKMKNAVIGLMALGLVIMGIELHQANYRLHLQTKTISNWQDFSDWQSAKMDKLRGEIKTNMVATNH